MAANNPKHEPDPAHEERIEAFRQDLRTHDIEDVIRKHITTGNPVVLTEEIYSFLRIAIAKKFGTFPNAVVLVGSCRTGFSMKPEKRYQPAAPDSDVDIAVVSPELFASYWDNVFRHARAERYWGQTHQGKRFVNDLFSGWITPRRLPNVPHFSNGREWAEFFDDLTVRRICGIRTIKARLYRSWDRLEAYQEIMVSRCREDLTEGRR